MLIQLNGVQGVDGVPFALHEAHCLIWCACNFLDFLPVISSLSYLEGTKAYLASSARSIRCAWLSELET